MNDDEVVQQHQGHLREGEMCPQERDIEAASQQYRSAKEQHDSLSDEGDCESEERKNHERNTRLREHGGEIRNRQRLPEQDAAVAALAVERVEAVKDRDNSGG